MELRNRVGLAFILIGCFLAGMLVLDMFGEAVFPQGTPVIAPGVLLDQVFTKAGFLYGPQSWRPGYDPLGIEPGQGVQDNETWYLMFINLNATPVSGDPNVKRVGSVRVTYNITALNGRAVFDVYGLSDDARSTRTNRQTGYNNCSFMVTGNATAGSSMPAAMPLAVSGIRQYRIAVSNNQQADYNSLTATTSTLAFYPPAGSGEAALHVTSSLAKRMGTLTETSEKDGVFYITANGAAPGNEMLLLVSVDRPQPDNFSLRIRSEFVRT